MSARKTVKRAPSDDKRARLAHLEQLTRDALKKAADLRKALHRGPKPDGRMLPAEGSQWRKHRAFVGEYETGHLWTFLMWAWGGHANNDHLAILETEIEGKPYRRAVPLDVLFVEFIPVPVKKGARS